MNGPLPRAAAIIVAAGDSTRMQSGGLTDRKPWIELGGVSVLEHTLRAFDAAETVSEIIIVAHANDVDVVRRLAAERPAFQKVRSVVAGGAERADSVRQGVSRCGSDVDVIAVHDAARPLIEPSLIDETVRRAAADGAALVALAVRDTIKVASEQQLGPISVDKTLDRSRLFAAQTPQAFRAKRFRQLIARAEADDFRPTDDAALWERHEGPVTVVEGSPVNLKITTPEDLELAAALLANRRVQEQKT